MTRMEGTALLVRIFIGEGDRHHGRPLYEAIVRAARSAGLAGATVLRGVEGYGADSVVHTARLLRLSEDLPVVVEVVELPERLEPFLHEVEVMLDEANCGGLITRERVEIVRYQPEAQR
jgi:PII-like signaling protein